jgi:hypothetical protein
MAYDCTTDCPSEELKRAEILEMAAANAALEIRRFSNRGMPFVRLSGGDEGYMCEGHLQEIQILRAL